MELNEWLVLVLLTLVGIFALVFASNGEGGMQSTIGLLIAAAAVVGIFYRVKQYFDRVDASHH
jgi:drug/metabolite transporter (DMT)-like permease